ncbi:hypothetical protein FACS1894137_18680 [Spirochaetia bacterium]|nr:hypothetical protein FACS1894137_18680 [Spirochaetia bacterium]
MKPWTAYLTDPRITEDPAMKGENELIIEIYAIRLLLQDETAGLSAEERIEQLNASAQADLARHGLPTQLIKENY